MIDICGLLLKILKSSTPGLLESGTTKIRQGGDGNGLAEVSALSHRRRFVNRPVGRALRGLFVLVVMAVCFGAGPAWGQTEDDSVRMIPLAAQVEVPPEIGAVDVEVVALGSDATEVEAGGKSSVLIASDADGTLMLAAANEDGGYLGEGPGAVELGIESTAITLVAVASGRRFGEIDPELVQTIRSHEEFGRLTRLLKALMASDKNYLDRLYSYPQAVTLIKSVAAGVASAGAEPSVEAGPGFKQLPERDVAQALAAGDAAASNSESGPIAPVYEDGFYCVPGSSFSWGIFPCSPWNDREPWHWYGNAEGIEALFPDNLLEWVFYFFGAPVAPDIVHTIINAKLGDYLPAPLPEGIYGKLANLIGEATGTPPFLAVAEDTVSGCRSFDISCKEDGLHATANPNFVNYAMELYEDGVYRDWFYTPGNSTINDKILNSGAAYREFQAGPRGDDSVLLSPAINQVRFQRYRFSFAEGDEAGPDRGAVVSFMNTLHLVISVVNVITDVSELRNGVNNADVLNLAQPILECSAEVVNVVKETNPDLIVDGQLVYNSDPEKEVQDLTVELLVNVGAAHLAALQRPACQNLLTGMVKGGVSKSLLKKGTSIIDDVFAAGGRQSVKATADYALIWIKLAVDVVNDLIPVASAYFRPAGDGVDYHLFWKENPKGTPFIHMVSKSRPPTAQFTYTQKGGFRVELDASQTEPGDSDDLSFSWRVNDADVGRGESIVHDFRAEGRYDVELIVVDGNGLSGTFSSAVDVVRGSPPEVTSLECTPTRYDTVRMVAAFSDEDGDIETVEWRSNAGSIEPDRVTSAGTTQVELRVSGSTTWASVIVEDRVGNRGSRVCNVNLEYVPTATLGIDSLSAACGREEPWRACYHRLGMNQGELFEFSVSMPREPTGTWHVAWCAKEEREGLCRGQHDWTTRIDKRFSNEAPLTFPMTPPAGAETFWVVAEVRECNKSLCNWPDDFTEVEFHHIEVSVLPPHQDETDRDVIVGPEGIEMLWVPPGEFQMGSTSSEATHHEQPVTQVRISQGFWMGKHEVTQGQWEAVMGSNPSHFTNCGGDCPVENVSWNEVQDFILRVNERERGKGYEYRLPTEAEWEYAARAGTTGDRYGDLDAIAWCAGNGGNRTHPVGQKAPNPWGFHDMLGNAWEYVQDWYGRYPGGSVTDPRGPATGPDRVDRGGGPGSDRRSCRASYRDSFTPTRATALGFRLVRDGSGSGGGGGGDGDETGQGVLFSEDFSSGTFDKWTAAGKESGGGSPDPGRLSIVDGVLQIDATAGGNYTLRVAKEILVAQRYGGYGLSFDWKAVARERPSGGDGVRLYFYDDQDQLIGQLVAYNSGQTRRGGDPLDHIRPTNLANDRFAGIGKLAETFDWESVTLDTSMIPGMDPRNVARLKLQAWVYNNAGSGGEMHFDNFELRAGGSGSDSGDGGDDDGGDDDETGQGVLFSEDFESYAVGSRPDDYVFVEGLTGRGRAEQRVESEGGNRHFRVVGRERATASLAKFFDFDLPPVVSVSWRMRVDDDVNTYPYRDPAGAQGATIGGFFIKNSEDTFGGTLIFKYQSDRKIVAWCLEGGGSRPEVPLGVWTEFRMDINFAAEQYSIYKDGQRFCSSLFPLGRYTSPPGIAFVSGDTVMRFDDIVIRGGAGSGGGGGGGSAGETRVFDGIEFVWAPPGEFQMGSTSSESRSNERPVTQVRISRGFWMGKYEVTQAQWEAVMGSNPSRFKNCGGDCPVEAVSWEDVQEFIGKLNARSGGRPYRLPTEAEWEYAARAGTTEDRYGDLDEIAWYRSNSRSTTHPVGEKAANAWGLHDMLGNVWEWVQDWHGSYPGGSVTAPTGPGSGSGRVRRGGGWGSNASSCRSARRDRNSPGNRVYSLGFRLLREE